MTYPEESYDGRGIVMGAGGHRLLANAYVTLCRIRRLSQLPIELFYCGAEELPTAARLKLEAEFSSLRCREMSQNLRGFQMKPFAILRSRFQEALWIDADNLPLGALDGLFDGEGYQRTGAQFWPDRREARWTQAELWRACGLEPLEGPEFESGQLLLDKRRCWRALLTTCQLNSDEHRPYVYGLTNGDKDTFRLAFLMTSTDFALVPHSPTCFGAPYLRATIGTSNIQIGHPLGRFRLGGLLQRDTEGRPLFAHRTVLEWNPYHDLKTMTHLEDGSRIESWIAELELQGHRDLERYRRDYLDFFPVEWWPRCQRTLLALLLPILDLIMSFRGRKSQAAPASSPASFPADSGCWASPDGHSLSAACGSADGSAQARGVSGEGPR